MPDFGAGLPWQARLSNTLAAVEDLAVGGLEERMRLVTAARILVTARQVADLVQSGALSVMQPQGGAPDVVTNFAAAWDPSATTAMEFAEILRPSELDRLLAAAPAWAREIAYAVGAASSTDRLKAA